jgi:hypothetical protein
LPPVINETSVKPNNVVLKVNSTADTMLFSAQFLQGITRAPTPGYLQVYSAATKQAVIVLDASNITNVPLVFGNTFQINIPVGLLPSGHYYILFDWGKFESVLY